MANTLDRFEAGSLAKSLDVHRPDFQQDIQLTPATVNMTSGLQEGIGPRYGMAPIPGHADQEMVSVLGTTFPGLVAAEVTGALTDTNNSSNNCQRTNVYGIFPLRMRGDGQLSPIAKVSTYYAVIIGYTTDAKAGLFLDVLLLSQKSAGAGGFFKRSPAFTDGLPYVASTIYTSSVNYQLNVSMLQGGNATSVLNATALAAGTNYVSATSFAVSGSEIPMQWIFGFAKATGGATTAPSIGTASFTFGIAPTYQGAGGEPPSFTYGNFATFNRDVSIFALDGFGGSLNDYSATVTPSTSIYHPQSLENSTPTTIDLSSVTATKITAGVNYAGVANALYNDGQLTCTSGYQGILVATGTSAVCTLFQDWYLGETGDVTQYVDISNIPLVPPSTNGTSGTPYTQDGARTPTGFNWWPAFVRGTAMGTGSGVALGAASTGLLRANTTYEFTYSIFDKRLNYETNVGTPVKIQTGVNDFVSLQLFSTAFEATTSTVSALWGKKTGNPILPWFGTISSFGGTANANYAHLNYLEYRFYYRQEGMTEWAPALFVDAAKFWFYPHWTPMAACTGGIGGLPAGRPGGFNDYSTLPKDNWNCVVMYKNRAFWFSDKAVSFSLQNNILAYAGRNSAACPVGTFKGALVHAYYGQAQQDARLVVFGSAATYVGKFTGNLQQVPVQVSVTSVGNFGLDGSDFVLNAWTSVTAFSYRSAVVAEGTLYFWGPQGIFMDGGVAIPHRISQPLETDLFDYYDTSKTDQIHCAYNDMTKEIIWFYPPAVADAANPTHALVYNTVKGTWLPQAFAGQVDAAQPLRIDTALPTAGSRLVVYSRASQAATIQRAYFFDQNNLAGDIYPGGELLVKQVATPSAGVRRLTLAAGYSTGTITVGDLIALQQTANYATSLATPSDMLAVVAAVGAGTIDITLPAGATLDSAWTAASNAVYFPVWHATPTGLGINGFPFELDTKYWIPGGMGYWAYWLYLHLVFKLTANLPAAAAPTVSLGYRTPISGETQTDVLTLTDNSDGNFQVLHPLTNVDQNLEGQGISLTVSGIQVGGAWVLQYLQAFAKALDGFQLKTFEA